ncbi:2-iminobutanoate/2-iminopropanoate deaminase-like isoform X1 [Ascaphus truei]|uniref:2-iminobutanoate/2-iminopropanoate deaminase-like isoform X1 n=1 Tax=Ascaphus truei TaxID=8439 RepID=UPI003F5A03C2
MAGLIRRIISTTKAPAAIGPYRSGCASEYCFFPCLPRGVVDQEQCCSQAVVVDKTMYVSGQLGMDPVSGQLVAGGVKNEATQALVNMGEILKAAGCSYSNVVKTTVLLADINDFNDMNEVYKQFFQNSFPARAAYQVAALPKGGRVEIEAVAVLGPITEISSAL